MVVAGAAHSGSIDQNRWTSRDWIACIGLLAATVGVILWQNAHVAVLWDLSYVLNAASRIAGGQVPYRDFPLVQAPLSFLLQAAIIRFTGRVYFHHVLYVALVGGVSTVLTWRIALDLLRTRVAAAWTTALLLAVPLTVLGIYCIVPNPEYDCDCAFWILVAVWTLQRLEIFPQPVLPSDEIIQQSHCHPERSLPRVLRQTQSKDLRLFFAKFRIHHPGDERAGHAILRGFLAGVALTIPLFFKQNIGLPFLLACLGAVLMVLATTLFKRDRTAEYKCAATALLAVLAGVGTALLAGTLTLHFTSGIGSCLHWTIGFAGQRRSPDTGLSTGRLSQSLSALDAGMHCGWAIGFTRARRESLGAGCGIPVARCAIRLRARCTVPLRRRRRARRQPAGAVAGAAAGARRPADRWNLVRLRRELTLRAFVPLILLVVVNGTMMSQQLWGSTYAIWPLLVLLLGEMIAFLDGLATHAGVSRWFAPALAALISASLLICGGFYTSSEERLSYAQFPEGPAMHSAYPVLAGMATPGPYIPEFDELLRYADAHIPFDDGIKLIPGEDPLFLATGRKQKFPTTDWDVTCDPYAPAEIAAMARARNIRWLIVKTDLQLKEDPTPDRAATMDLLMREFTPAAHLRGYEIYHANTAE